MVRLEPTESQIQIAYFDWVALKRRTDPRYEYIIKIPNDTRGNYGWRRRMGKEGLSPGVPDVVCLYPVSPFSGLALEFKRPKGKTSKDQDQWLKRLSDAKWLTQIVYNVEMAVSVTESYFDFCRESRCKL